MKRFGLAQLWPWLAAISSGLLYAACFDPINQSWLCWICLTPLLGAVWFSGSSSRRPWLRNLGLGYVTGLVFFTAVFAWFGTLGTLYSSFFLHGLSFLLSLYLALYIAWWAVFCGLVRPPHSPLAPVALENHPPDKWHDMLRSARNEPVQDKAPPSPWIQSWRNLLVAFVLASAWTAGEWIRGWLFSGFGWNGLGIALHQSWVLIQVAEFTGVPGLSFVVAFANVIALTTVCRFVVEVRSRIMRPHWDLNLTMLGIVALILLGWNLAKAPRLTRPVSVAAVQPDIPQLEKLTRPSSDHIFQSLQRLSGEALKRNPPPELLVWPESALPGPAFADESSHEFLLGFSASTSADILLGSDEIEPSEQYNGALLVSGGGQSFQTYRKIHLVPFGEYIPGRHAFPLFAAIAGRWVPGDFSFGKDYTVFRLTNGYTRVAPLVCFEDTVAEVTRKFILPKGNEPGANLLVNITNDGWFLRSAGSHQHLANAIFRCIETRRPMVRAANTGVTCFVNQLGRITEHPAEVLFRAEGSDAASSAWEPRKTGILDDDHGNTFGEGVLYGTIEVPADGELTFFVRHGDLAGPTSAAIAGLTIAGVFAFRGIRRRQAAASL